MAVGTWILIVVVVGFVALQLLPHVLARGAKGKVVPEVEGLLGTAQAGARRVLVYFWSPTCAVCRPMSSAIDAVGSAEIVKVNLAEKPQLAAAFRVMATPSLAVMKKQGDAGWALQELLVGAKNEAQLRALLQSST